MHQKKGNLKGDTKTLVALLQNNHDGVMIDGAIVDTKIAKLDWHSTVKWTRRRRQAQLGDTQSEIGSHRRDDGLGDDRIGVPPTELAATIWTSHATSVVGAFNRLGWP